MTEMDMGKRLIDLLLDEVTPVSIDDDIMHSLRREDLYENLAICDNQFIRTRKGYFFLVWGNASDGSELIADCSDNPFCNAIYNKWEQST